MNEFNLEKEKSRQEVATYLRQLADGLEDDDKVTLISGEQSVTINPPGSVHFRIRTDSNSSWLGGENGKSVNIELGWEASDVETDDELTIVQQTNRARSDRARGSESESVVDDQQQTQR